MDHQTNSFPTIDLLSRFKQDVTNMISSEYALLKFETNDRLEAGKSVAALMGVAAILGLLAGFMAFVAIAKGLTAVGVPDPISYAIVAIVAAAVAAVLLKMSQQRMKDRVLTPIKLKKG
jgi:Putative Actinobacterial Holin-X, holin superfamily III